MKNIDDLLFDPELERWWLLSCANEWSIFAWHEDLTNDDRLQMWKMRKEVLERKEDSRERIVLKFVLDATGRLLCEKAQ